MVVNIAKTIQKWIIGIILLLMVTPTVLAEFFPGPEGINLENQANITNITRTYVDEYCYNNNTCFLISNLDVVEVENVWPISITAMFLGGAVVFVLIGWSLKQEREEKIWWHEGLRFTFYIMALAMVMQAGAVQTEIVSLESVTATAQLDNVLQNATLWPYRIFFWFFFSVVVIFFIIALTRLWFHRKISQGKGGDPLGRYEGK